MEVYFDNAATTPLSSSVKEAIELYINGKTYGNPSSLYSLGISAAKEIESAKETLASFVKCRPCEIYFTSGGTESNSTAILGAARALKRRGNRIITSAIEHPSVLNPIAELEKEGFEVIRVMPSKDGNISLSDVLPYINDKTILASFMLCNNETGALLPVSEIAVQLKRICPFALMHVDAVGALGKTEISLSRIKCDLMSFSAHKIFALKGTGALFIRSSARILPLLYGGGQEKGMRSGTENTLGICAFKAAVSEFSKAFPKYEENVSAVHSHIISNLPLSVTVNSPDGSIPHIINISVKGFRSEIMLHYLEGKNIFVSSGSACSSKKKGSHVLSSMGKSADEIDSALRISLSPYNTIEQADIFLNTLSDGIKTLARR